MPFQFPQIFISLQACWVLVQYHNDIQKLHERFESYLPFVPFILESEELCKIYMVKCVRTLEMDYFSGDGNVSVLSYGTL